jgi:DNA repair ATPase RecN
MAAPAFGFSVGDFVAVTSLIVSVVQAIRGISDDLIELKELQDELNHLQSLFEQIGRGISSSCAISVQNVERLQQIFSRCNKILGDFKNFIEKYASSSTGLAKYRRRVEWSLRKKQQVEPFRRRLQSYVSALSIIQGELSR